MIECRGAQLNPIQLIQLKVSSLGCGGTEGYYILSAPNQVRRLHCVGKNWSTHTCAVCACACVRVCMHVYLGLFGE